MTILLIDIVVVRYNTCVGTLIFETNNVILSPKYNIFESGVLCSRNFECPAVCPSGYLRASYHVYKTGCLLVRGISLPSAQLFVIAIESILRGVCGRNCVPNTRDPCQLPFLLSNYGGPASGKERSADVDEIPRCGERRLCVRVSSRLFGMPLVAPHIEAVNVTALRSTALGNVAPGAVLSGFGAAYVVAYDAVPGRVRARQRAGRGGLGRPASILG